MSTPVYISSNEDVIISDPYVIFYQEIPRSVAWDNTAQPSYYMVNSTGQDIPFADGSFYFDANSVMTTKLAAGVSLYIYKSSLNNWMQVTDPGTIAESVNNSSIFYTLPTATSSRLGGIKVGSGLSITNDGRLSANAAPVIPFITSITTNGNSGPATVIGGILNVPIYTGGGGAGTWGSITGTLSNQTDLNNALNSKLIAADNLSDIPSPSIARANLGVPAQVNLIQGANVTISGSYPDLTIAASSGGTPVTSFPQLSTLGILTNGSDQTTALNTIFGNSAYKGVIVDFQGGGAITISGTVNAQGKTIIFRPGSYFTGNGTIASAIISAGLQQKLFDVSVSLSGCGTQDNKFSALWYGFVINTGDATYSIQKSIDTCISNGVRTLYFPSGTYFINQPLMIYNWNGSQYTQVTLRLEGETPFWQASGHGSTIRVNGFHSGFALGMQIGKGVEVKQLSFLGTFTPPNLTNDQFYTIDCSAYGDGVSTDTVNAPFSGIVIDPFGPSTPGGGAYPSITTYNGTTNFYRGAGAGGSTGCIFEDLVINNFVIGFITSPSGQTSNAELMHLFKVQFTNNKICIVGCQDQEKLNKVEHLACWGGHTIFVSGGSVGGGYGAVTPGHWVFDGMNLAGRVNRIIGRQGSGYFPMTMKHIFAESLGSIGTWYGSQGDSLEDSSIDLVDLGTFPHYPASYSSPSLNSVSHFNSLGVTVRNCTIRYYGAYTPLVFNGGTFENCSFDKIPLVFGSQTVQGTFVNCGTGNGALGGTIDSVVVYRSASARHLIGGSGRFIDAGEYGQGKQISLSPRVSANSLGALYSDGLNNLPSTWTISGSTATVTPPTAADLNRVIPGTLIMDGSTGKIMGIVGTVGGSTYTINYVPVGITNGSGIMLCFCPTVIFSFIGTITSGSPDITNVTLDFGSWSDLQSYASGYLQIPGFYGPRSYSQGARAISMVGSTITMDRPALYSATNYYFINGHMERETFAFSTLGAFGSGSEIKVNEPFAKGQRLMYDRPDTGFQEFICTKTGFYNQAPFATFCELTALCTTTSTTTTTTTT